MPNTEAMNKARIKYAQNVKQVATAIDKQIYDIMLQDCKQKDMTKKNLLRSVYYIIPIMSSIKSDLTKSAVKSKIEIWRL